MKISDKKDEVVEGVNDKKSIAKLIFNKKMDIPLISELTALFKSQITRLI